MSETELIARLLHEDFLNFYKTHPEKPKCEQILPFDELSEFVKDGYISAANAVLRYIGENYS